MNSTTTKAAATNRLEKQRKGQGLLGIMLSITYLWASAINPPVDATTGDRQVGDGRFSVSQVHR